MSSYPVNYWRKLIAEKQHRFFFFWHFRATCPPVKPIISKQDCTPFFTSSSFYLFIFLLRMIFMIFCKGWKVFFIFFLLILIVLDVIMQQEPLFGHCSWRSLQTLMFAKPKSVYFHLHHLLIGTFFSMRRLQFEWNPGAFLVPFFGKVRTQDPNSSFESIWGRWIWEFWAHQLVSWIAAGILYALGISTNKWANQH